MEKRYYEPPRTQSVMLMRRELFCASNMDATFSNEGFGADDEEFVW